MRIGILGTGDVARALGRGFVALGHEVRLGSRARGHGQAVAFVKEQGERASEGAFGDAASFGEILILATLGIANEAVLAQAGPAHFAGKVVIDATNPLDASRGFPPRLAISGEDSGGEQVQRLLPEAKVVKAWNTVGHAFMFRPEFPGGPPDMFICGDDAEAKKVVEGILGDFGWSTVDVGDIRSSRYLEAMCMVWVLSALKAGHWNQAFKMLRK